MAAFRMSKKKQTDKCRVFILTSRHPISNCKNVPKMWQRYHCTHN